MLGLALAAHKLCQLAVMLASCRLPHDTARGVALSLWHGALVPPPGSPEPLFTALIAAHPRLAGQFPATFDSQSCFRGRPRRGGRVGRGA